MYSGKVHANEEFPFIINNDLLIHCVTVAFKFSKSFSLHTIALTGEAKLWEDTRDSQGNWRVECRIQQ